MAKEPTTEPPPSGNSKKDDNEDLDSNIGSGPLFRRRVIRRRVIRGNKASKKKAGCFNWLSLFTCLVTMEGVALVFLVLRSHTILIDPSLEEDAFHFLVWLDTTLGGGGEHDREELEQLEAWLVQRTEDRLDHGHLLEHEAETEALDNYYNRSHFSPAAETKPTVLIVAGMQGSGGRAVVDALMRLDIPMITMDHSQLSESEKDKKSYHVGFAAWREMINIVLSSGIHTSNYEFKSLPRFSQIRIQQQWEKLYQGYIHKLLPETPQDHKTLFGFQAHDALFMLPVFQEFMVGPLKVVHVVRDGRDVTLLNSKPKIGKDNKEHPMHSMAERFVMETYYGVSNTTKSYDDKTNLTSKDQSIVEAMELWNDWNLDSLEWLQKHSKPGDNHLLDYLQLRTEDLLSPEKKLEALIELAHFTGTSETMPFEKLCCMSRQALVVESSEYQKSFAKAKAQQEVLKKYSAQLSFRHEEEAEEERRKARLGDLIVGNKFRRRRHPGPVDGSPVTDTKDAVRKEVHEHRQNRFQDIGDRLAARLPANPAEGRRLMETQLIDKAPFEEDEGGESDVQPKGSGGNGRIKSPEVKAMFKQYFAWRKSLHKARNDPEAAAAAIEKGQQLLAEYRKHEEHLKGVLTEDSFTRSIHWLQNLHADEDEEKHPLPPPDHISHRYGKWAQVLSEQPHLARRLNTVGGESLQRFGYEPRTRFIDFDPENKKAKCHMEVVCS